MSWIHLASRLLLVASVASCTVGAMPENTRGAALAWIAVDQLLAPSGAATDRFGTGVAISEDTLVVGAPFDDDAGLDSGAAFVFVRSGSSWIHQQTLTSTTLHAFDDFGRSVAISGDTIVVGAQGDNANGGSPGAAYVFVRSGSTWTQQQKLMASNVVTGNPPVNSNVWSEFGSSVAINGDRAIVGSRFGRMSTATVGDGLAYSFTRSGSTWTEVEILDASNTGTGDQIGYSVALDGTTTVVGAPEDDDGGTSAGTAWVFEL